ncbi:MAG: serine/threonine-protein kinase, partial [Planctomycetota bacterium]|nr:serine/threonine-protein kinase [Planctomycetota bacterium]
MQFLTVARGPDQGREFLIDSGKTYKVGSDDGADIVLTDPRVLGEHCSLSAEDGSILLTDLTASAGTFVGDKRVKRGRLPHGTAFRVGDSVLVVKVKHATPAARAAAPKPPLERVTLQSPLLGKIIGGYKFNEVVGRGGMGTVFRATQLSLHREVAVKVLAQKHEDDDAFVEQFINEARAAAQLIHHNVVQVYDAGREGKLSYFSMEFMAHGSVEEHLEREGKIPWEEAILMVLDAAHGLEFAQEKGIVHRDIKPDNLMIDEKGRVKIADLGLAKHDRKAGGTKQEVIGTPHFIPPEQALGKDVDHRADLYSLGATFFRIITGRTLFTGNTAKEIVLKHIHEAWPAASSVEPSIPDELDLAISRMLAKNPDDRPQSATEVISELESICAHHGIKGAVIKTGVSKRVLVPLVLLLLAAIGVTTHFVTKDPEFLEDTASKEAAARAQEEARRDRDAAAAAKRGERAQSVRAAHGALAGRELAQSRIRSLDETFDDEKSEAVREKAWRDVAQAYEDFAEDPANQELDVDDVLKMAAADATRINYRLDKLKA